MAASAPPLAARAHGPGRPRSPEADRAILAAALEALVEDGFAAMSIEGVAARAGVAKSTIYRRWPCKADLVVDAVNARSLEQVPLPDTGDVRRDLVEFLAGFQTALAGPDGPTMIAFAAEQLRHPVLADAFRRQFVADRRAAVRALVERGIERGQLPSSTDAELLADVGPALLWHRVIVTGGALDDDLPARVVAQFLPR